MAKDFYIGVDVGGTKIAAAVVTPAGKILGREKAPTPRGRRASAVLSAIVDVVEDAMRDADVKPRRLKAVGIGVPGIVDAAGGRVVAAPNIPIAGAPIAATLRRRFGVEVTLGNDVNLGVLGERWLGAGRGVDDVVGVFPGTGVGGGVVCGGRLLTGAHGAAAELGHIVLNPGGPLCGCGARGCLEAYASRTAIERDLREGARAGRRTEIVSINGGRLDVIKSRVLAEALRRRDPLVTEVMRAAAERLGDGCVAARHCFDPKLIVLGGGLVEACGGFILPIVRARIAADPLFRRVGECRVAPAKLGDYATILGAVALARG
jgi:glucokinase